MYMQRERKMKEMVGSSEEGDTKYRKIFVGGLAWGTQRESMKAYFEQFGQIVEAVVIADKHTGRSKGYGFVTFKDPNSAIKACQDPYPVIDGRRTNCNLAAFGSPPHKNAPNTPQRGLWKVRSTSSPSSSSSMTMARPALDSLGVSTYNYQPLPEYAYPYGAYGYPSYQQDIYTVSYYNAAYGIGGQLQDFPAQYVIGSPNELYFSWYQYPLLPLSTTDPKTTQQTNQEATATEAMTVKGAAVHGAASGSEHTSFA
ncbi:probable RNA-binding protein ARP1 isoform X2 [Humulus lupulus]|uniref:probable RNA-binding protein ARP1 isoform X2 n=1 Tax=Humulus lupulus TaxID=3486 RepID=UPI002B40F40E|nr:probable RNA-binding protein ARP1 isoform X2 [Humulus lupulus]